MLEHKSLRLHKSFCAGPTLSCEQIPCLLRKTLHNFRVARATAPLKWMPMITSIPYWTVTLSVSLFQEFRCVELGGHEPLHFSLDSRLFSGSCSIPHSSPREHRPFVVHCTPSPLFLFPLPLDLPLAAAAAEAGFHEKGNASHECSAPSIGPPYFYVWRSLAIHSFEQYLECTETAMASAILTVDALTVIYIIQTFFVGLLLHRDDGSVPIAY